MLRFRCFKRDTESLFAQHTGRLLGAVHRTVLPARTAERNLQMRIPKIAVIPRRLFDQRVCMLQQETGFRDGFEIGLHFRIKTGQQPVGRLSPGIREKPAVEDEAAAVPAEVLWRTAAVISE